MRVRRPESKLGIQHHPLPLGEDIRTAPVLLAADVGGTHVRIGLIRTGTDASGPVEVLHYRKFACADYPGLAEVLATYILEAGDVAVRVKAGAIACAGHVMPDGRFISANLPWPIAPAEILARLGWNDLQVVNDFEAVAHAATRADASALMLLCGPAAPMPGPTLVLGPGTGLGAALRIPTEGRPLVLATEAGHAALTAGTELEMAVLREFQKERGHVPIEHALSGPGLMRLHAALRKLHGDRGGYDTPEQITTAALAGDPRASETLGVFCGLLGSTVGDMALLYGAHGGILLAGGFLPNIREFLAHSSFAARYLNKGAMRTALERIPVRLVEHGQLGVIGAARWYLDHQGRNP